MHGIPFRDVCPLTRNGKSAIYMLDKPASLFPFDRLHMSDGVVDYFASWLELLIPSLLKRSMECGNMYLHTKRAGLHIMEYSMESFGWLTLALYKYRFAEVSEKLQKVMFNTCCALLAILAYLSDSRPLTVLHRLKQEIATFKVGIDLLLSELAAKGVVKHYTTKMHELFEHVALQVREFQHSANCSTKPMELHHSVVVNLFNRSSRCGVGVAAQEVTVNYYYKQMIREAKHLEERGYCSIPRDKPYDLEPVFKVPSLPIKITLNEMLDTNIRSVEFLFESKLIGTKQSILGNENAQGAFGNSLHYHLTCRVRQVQITPSSFCAVSTAIQTQYRYDGAFHVLVYKGSSSVPILDPSQLAPVLQC